MCLESVYAVLSIRESEREVVACFVTLLTKRSWTRPAMHERDIIEVLFATFNKESTFIPWLSELIFSLDYDTGVDRIFDVLILVLNGMYAYYQSLLTRTKSTPSKRRLIRDFKRLSSDPPGGISGAPCADNLLVWNAVIFGPGMYICE